MHIKLKIGYTSGIIKYLINFLGRISLSTLFESDLIEAVFHWLSGCFIVLKLENWFRGDVGTEGYFTT